MALVQFGQVHWTTPSGALRHGVLLTTVDSNGGVYIALSSQSGPGIFLADPNENDFISSAPNTEHVVIYINANLVIAGQ